MTTPVDPQLQAAQDYLKNNPLPNTATTLLQNNPGLDHQTAVTLAHGGDPNAAHQQAQAITQQVQQSGVGALEHSFYDPVLSAQPSAVMAAASYLHSTLGPPPVSGGTITQIQQALAKDGFLSSGVNGVWDANSQNAYANAISAYKSQQVAGGHKGLSSMFSSAIHSLVHTATHPWDAIAGFGKDVRSLVGDLAGGAAGLGAAVTNPLGDTTGVSGTVSANVQRALGRTNYTDQQGIHDDNWRHGVGDLFTAAGLLTLGGVSVLKQGGKEAIKSAIEDAGKTAAEKATQETTAAATEQAVTRLQHIGVALNAAHNFGFVGRSISDIGDSLAAGTLPATDALVQRNLGIVAKTLLSPAKISGKVVGSKWGLNLPGAARLAPVLTKIGTGANEGGWAYNLRNFYGMSPYRLGAVRAVGTAVSRSQVAALGLHGMATTEGALGVGDPSNIQDTSVQPLDHWADNTTWNPIPGPKLSAADLLLGFGIHGDMIGANRASRVIGDTVNAWQNAVADLAGKTGVIGAFEHTTGVAYDKLLKIAGGDSAALHLWMQDHQATAAEDQWLTHELGHPPFATGDPAKDAVVDQLRETYRLKSDEEKQTQQALFVNADPHHQFLRNHLTGSFLRNANTKAAKQAATENSLRDYLTTVPLGQDLIHSGAAQFFIGPNGRVLAREDAAFHALSSMPVAAKAGPGLPALYHGSASAFPGDKLAPTGEVDSGAGNLFGHGFYTTNSENVANSYNKKGSGRPTFGEMLADVQKRGLVPQGSPIGYDDVAKLWDKELSGATYSVHWKGQGTPKLLDLDKTAPQNIRDWVTAQVGHPTFDATDETVSEIQKMLADPEATSSQLIRAFRTALGEGGITKSEADDVMRDLSDSLETEGFDGFKHVGGVFRGDAQVKHGVHIFFNNENLSVTRRVPEGRPPGGFESSAHMATLYHGEHAALDPNQPGAIGMMRLDGKTSNGVLAEEVPQFQAEIDRISKMTDSPSDAVATTKLVGDMRDFLHTHLDWDAARLQLLGDDPQRLLDTIKTEATKLAADVYHTSDIPEWAVAKEKAINDAGFKVVVGTHVGHQLDGTLPDLGPIDGKLTTMRKYMGKVGLDPMRVQDVDVSKAQTLSIQSRVHNLLVKNPNMLTTSHADYRTVMQVLHHGIDKALPAAARGIFNAFSNVGLNKSNIRLLAETKYVGEDGKMLPNAVELARHELEQQMAAQAGLRDVPLHRALDALKQTHDIPLPGGGSFTWNGIAEADARKIMAAVDQGYRLPGYMMGWQAVENWARAGFGMSSFLMNHQPEKTFFRVTAQPLYRAVSNWPNAVLHARNNLRFTYSAVFGLRRLIKQDYKMKLEGVAPTWNALNKMVDSGELEAAMKTWGKVRGQQLTDQMETDRNLIGRDIFGLYDPEWHGMYFSHELAKQGKSPEEIKDAYNRVFKYGADGGRTGLERTTNTIFFPFSFEKTLLRNTGGYLLDHPGQAMALDLAVEEWRKLDNNAQVGKWVNDHFPLLKQMQMFNAFSHGISPGQFGGVNAPILGSLLKAGSTASKDATSGHSEALLNLLMPQSWGINFTKANIAQYAPVWGQLNKLMDAAYQQAKIGVGSAHDTLVQVAGYNWRPMTALSSQAQYQYALRRKGQLALQLEPIIKYNNAQGSDADKVPWPDSFPSGVAGHPINKTSIAAYMQYLYPAYNPQKAQDQAKQYAKQADAFVASFKTSDPAKYSQMVAFKKLADTVTLNLARDAYDTPQAAQIQNLFQQKLESAAMSDPDWRALYENFYAHSIGPIRSFSGKGVSA